MVVLLNFSDNPKPGYSPLLNYGNTEFAMGRSKCGSLASALANSIPSAKTPNRCCWHTHSAPNDPSAINAARLDQILAGFIAVQIAKSAWYSCLHTLLLPGSRTAMLP
jgi:hypothetical protein